MRLLTITLLIILLNACAATGVYVDEKDVTQFEKGKTTYREVVNVLGTPTQKKINSSGDTIISYIYSEYKTRAETFIPYVGSFVGGSDTRMNTATFEFDKSEILTDYEFSETAMGTTTNLAAPVPNDRVETKIRKD